MKILSEILALIILILVAAVIFKIIINYGGLVLKIALHLLSGWITLIIVNIIPGIDIPINILTLVISGFGGITGTILLVILNIIT